MTIILKNKNTEDVTQFTNVYGPSVDIDKPAFIEELKMVAWPVQHPWIITGNFNLICWVIDRSGDFRGFGLVDSFNGFIRDAGLINVPLRNPKYTWSSKKPVLNFSKLDRVFTTMEWTLRYLIISLEALEMTVSDHVPLILSCQGVCTVPRRYKIETFWLKYEAPKHMVQQLWSNCQAQPQDSLNIFQNNSTSLQKDLAIWHRQGFNEMEKQLALGKNAVLFFDTIEEKRALAGYEFRLRCKIKERVFELACNLEEK